MRNSQKAEHIAGILGIGLGAPDGHVRITQGERFSIHQGSDKEHEQMREICMKIEGKLKEQGRRLEDLTVEEFIEIAGTLE